MLQFIILFNKKKNRKNFFRQRRKLKNITAHQFLTSYVHKDSYHVNTSEEVELRNTFNFVNESLKVENRKLLKLAKSEKKRKTSNNKHDGTPAKYLNVLHHNKTQKQLQHFFLNTLK